MGTSIACCCVCCTHSVVSTAFLPPIARCSGPYGLQPKGSHTFNFTTLDASGQATSAAGHECWLEAVPAGGGGGGGAAADYKPCSSPVELAADIKVRQGSSTAAARAGCTPPRCAHSGGMAAPNGVAPAAPPRPLQDGAYRFHARVAGSSDAGGTEAVAPFSIDSVAPTVTFEGAPVQDRGQVGLGRRDAAACRACRVRLLSRSLLPTPASRCAVLCLPPLPPPADLSDLVAGTNATSLQFRASEEGSSFYCG